MTGAFLVCDGKYCLEIKMWKLVVGFIVFAALAMYMLSRGGDIDLGGEKHGASSPKNVVTPVGALVNIS